MKSPRPWQFLAISDETAIEVLDEYRVRFTFPEPVRITEIELQNLFDEERFKKNYKIQGYLITTDDLTIEISGRLANTNDAQRIPIASLGTTELLIEVKNHDMRGRLILDLSTKGIEARTQVQDYTSLKFGESGTHRGISGKARLSSDCVLRV